MAGSKPGDTKTRTYLPTRGADRRFAFPFEALRRHRQEASRGCADIVKFPIHLGLGARAVVEPEFTGAVEWYAGYEGRHGADGAEGRLVSMHTFSAPWPMWEMHLHGSEMVLCTAGAITVHPELPGGSRSSAVLGPGQYAVNPPGAWHTADVDGQATVLFITAGLGTRHRPR